MSGTGLRVAGGIAKKTGAKKAAGVSGELRMHLKNAFDALGLLSDRFYASDVCCCWWVCCCCCCRW
jgi:hypothetical protein